MTGYTCERQRLEELFSVKTTLSLSLSYRKMLRETYYSLIHKWIFNLPEEFSFEIYTSKYIYLLESRGISLDGSLFLSVRFVTFPGIICQIVLKNDAFPRPLPSKTFPFYIRVQLYFSRGKRNISTSFDRLAGVCTELRCPGSSFR